MDLEKLALDGILYEHAVDNQGTYPQSIEGGSNPYKKRTDKMEGHNECILNIERTRARFKAFINDSEFIQDIKKALFEEYVTLHESESKIMLTVPCNDLFFWAVADSEAIQPNELSDLFECYNETPRFGGFLWVCRKNKMRPQAPWYDDFGSKERDLFDACGPIRDE